MTYTARITETKTGDVRDVPFDGEWDSTYDDYLWFDGGNYTCDGNRSLFFARAGGEPEPEHECSIDRFTVVIIDDTGAVVASDD